MGNEANQPKYGNLVHPRKWREEARDMRKTILIVENELRVLRLLRVNLHYAGYRVLTATNGAEALSEIVLQQIDLMVFDTTLPVAPH
jgi:CheY-like chemotaxis protein